MLDLLLFPLAMEVSIRYLSLLQVLTLREVEIQTIQSQSQAAPGISASWFHTMGHYDSPFTIRFKTCKCTVATYHFE